MGVLISMSPVAQDAMEVEIESKLQDLCLNLNGSFQSQKGPQKDNKVNSDEESREDGSEERVFSNHLLLEKIFKHLSLEDLKLCRGINLASQIEATKALLGNYRTKPIRLELTYEKYVASLPSTEFNPSPVNDRVDSFVTAVKSSKRFPSNNISVCLLGEENKTCIQDLFTSHGKDIQELELCIHNPVGSDFLQQVFKQLYKLERLSIVRIPEEWTEFPKSVFLVKLTHLNYSGDISKAFLSQLFDSAPFIRTFTCETTIPHNLAVLQRLHRIHLLKEIKLIFTPNRMTAYEALATQSPKFEAIRGISYWNWEGMIPVASERIAHIISSILHSSASTLTTISKCPPLGFVTSFPPLPKLRELELNYPHNYNNDRNKVIFPPHLDLEETFPHLVVLRICPKHNGEFYGNRPHQLFNTQMSIPSVKVLHLGGNESKYRISLEWLRFFSNFLPNLAKVNFSTFLDFPEAAEGIWSFTMLEELEMTVDLCELPFPFPDLDVAFTGLSVETCCSLRGCAPEDLPAPSEVEQQREHPSILDLTRLEILHLNFEDSDGWEGEKYDVILSHLTGHYAFQMKPKLQVYVVARYLGIQEGLEEILPFVKSFPEVLLP